MKFNKMMFAALAFSALAIVSCKQKPDDPVGPVGPGGGGDDPQPTLNIPEVAAPADGYVTIVINIPANSECNGIAFKGTRDNSSWSGKDTYVGETAVDAPAASCIKFAPVPNAANWYQATYKLGEGYGLEGKVCLIFSGDKDWNGQAVDVEIIEDYTTAEYEMSGNLKITKGGLLYMKVGSWLSSECATLETYNLTFLVPAFCDGEFDMEVVGSFEKEGWGTSPVACAKAADGKYTASVQAGPKTILKIRGKGGWDKEIQKYVAAEDKWEGCDNVELGTEKNVSVDYTDAEKFRWSHCAQ